MMLIGYDEFYNMNCPYGMADKNYVIVVGSWSCELCRWFIKKHREIKYVECNYESELPQELFKL